MPCSRPWGCSSAWASGPKSMAHKLALTGRGAPVGGPVGRAHLCLRRLPPRPARLSLLTLSPDSCSENTRVYTRSLPPQFSEQAMS